jgi:hypothetical protein
VNKPRSSQAGPQKTNDSKARVGYHATSRGQVRDGAGQPPRRTLGRVHPAVPGGAFARGARARTRNNPKWIKSQKGETERCDISLRPVRGPGQTPTTPKCHTLLTREVSDEGPGNERRRARWPLARNQGPVLRHTSLPLHGCQQREGERAVRCRPWTVVSRAPPDWDGFLCAAKETVPRWCA